MGSVTILVELYQTFLKFRVNLFDLRDRSLFMEGGRGIFLP